MVALRTIEEYKVRKQKQVKNANGKYQPTSPRQVVKKLAESNLKIKSLGKDLMEISKERTMSPYAISWQKSTGKLPLLQTSKKKIVGLKLEKMRKKSKGKK